MIDLHPTKCNICGGDVIYTSNSVIYGGREYSSGKCYLCTNCHAYVGTHKPRPTEALGLLSNKEMREKKMRCHDLFDTLWKNEPTSMKRRIARKAAYQKLSNMMDIPVEECHFGYFDLKQLEKAYAILQKMK